MPHVELKAVYNEGTRAAVTLLAAALPWRTLCGSLGCAPRLRGSVRAAACTLWVWSRQ